MTEEYIDFPIPKSEKADGYLCQSCKKSIYHDKRYCPEYPKVRGVKKWERCVCTIHTCFSREDNDKA